MVPYVELNVAGAFQWGALEPEEGTVAESEVPGISAMRRSEESAMAYRNAEAMSAFRVLCDSEDSTAEAFLTLAKRFHASGRIREAIVAYQRVLERDPANDAAGCALGQLPALDNPALDELLLVSFDAQGEAERTRHFAKAVSGDYIYNIDPVGACNLRCPSCAQSRSMARGMPHNQMTLKTFKSILAKIAREHPKGRVIAVNLFNWGEAFLHKDLPAFIRATRAAGFRCGLSTNLNHALTVQRLEEILGAGPDVMRISISGFTNQTHQQQHARGDINLVKANMHLVRHVLDRLGLNIAIEVGYLLYRHNFGQDFVRVRQLCDSLCFRFDYGFSTLTPIETLQASAMGHIEDEYAGVLDALLMTPLDWFHWTAQAPGFVARPASECPLKTNMIAINSDGSVPVCCASALPENNVATDYLQVPFEELEQRRANMASCAACEQVRSVFLNGDKLEAVAKEFICKRMNAAGAFIGSERYPL